MKGRVKGTDERALSLRTEMCVSRLCAVNRYTSIFIVVECPTGCESGGRHPVPRRHVSKGCEKQESWAAPTSRRVAAEGVC